MTFSIWLSCFCSQMLELQVFIYSWFIQCWQSNPGSQVCARWALWKQNCSSSTHSFLACFYIAIMPLSVEASMFGQCREMFRCRYGNMTYKRNAIAAFIKFYLFWKIWYMHVSKIIFLICSLKILYMYKVCLGAWATYLLLLPQRKVTLISQQLLTDYLPILSLTYLAS